MNEKENFEKKEDFSSSSASNNDEDIKSTNFFDRSDDIERNSLATEGEWS